MKILFVLGGLRIGGYEILSVKIANECAERNNRVAILSLSNDMEILEKVSSKIKTYFAIRKFKYDFSIVCRISKVLRNFQPDFIVSCFYFEYLLSKYSSFLYSNNPRFILAFHLTKPFDRKEDRWNRIYAALTKMFNDKYIAIHSSQIDFYNKRYGLPRSRFTLIRNGVDTNYFRPEEKKDWQNDGIFRITHIASLKPLKDQWTLLKSMVELDKIYGKWELKVAGEDQSNLLPAYSVFIKQSGLETKIKFLGPVDNIRKVLSDSDVFILTSFTEALPISVIEAIAMGLPCIVTDVGGNSDIIEHGKEGFLIEPGDYSAIANHLNFLIENPEERKKMSNAAREKAVKQFDIRVMVDKYCKLFDSVFHK